MKYRPVLSVPSFCSYILLTANGHSPHDPGRGRFQLCFERTLEKYERRHRWELGWLYPDGIDRTTLAVTFVAGVVFAAGVAWYWSENDDE